MSDKDLKDLVTKARYAYARTRDLKVVLHILREGRRVVQTTMSPEEILMQYEEYIIKEIVRP